jgi:hypothetical protein
VFPLLNFAEDIFVNGLSFKEDLRIFIGLPTKNRLMRILEQYYGRIGKIRVLSWRQIIKLAEDMFSHNKDSENMFQATKRVTFYGNDGVCLFKYFVNVEDPQRAFVWTVLMTNFFCFSVILISYSLIAIQSKVSSKAAGNGTGRRERNQKLQRKITMIITTDFCSWIPFIVVCIFHYFNVIDATPWYSLFSMIILPINSVINPLLYNSFSTRILFLFRSNAVKPFSKLSEFIQTSIKAKKSDRKSDSAATVKYREKNCIELENRTSDSKTLATWSTIARDSSL